MSWNYRIIRFPRSEKDAALTGTTHYYALHEVYYDDTGAPNAYTAETISFICDTAGEVIHSLATALHDARTRLILNVEDIKGYAPNG